LRFRANRGVTPGASNEAIATTALSCFVIGILQGPLGDQLAVVRQVSALHYHLKV
jgi:hypothetical protein